MVWRNKPETQSAKLKNIVSSMAPTRGFGKRLIIYPLAISIFRGV
jgi:hypothetical protein